MLKLALLSVLAVSLLLFGCAGQQSSSEAAPAAPQAQEPSAPPAMPPAPGNPNTPAVPEGAQASPPPAPSGSSTTPQTEPGQQAATSGAAGVTLAVLSQHNAESDCWFGYKGKAYDATNLIPSHKNYKELLVPLCGKASEFEQAFEGKHGTSKVQILIDNSEYKGDLVASG